MGIRLLLERSARDFWLGARRFSKDAAPCFGALRQFGSLPYSPARATSILPQTESFGIHPEIRRLCRSAAAAMHRYPVKDPLPFDEEEGEVIEPDEILGEGVDDIDEEIAVDA